MSNVEQPDSNISPIKKHYSPSLQKLTICALRPSLFVDKAQINLQFVSSCAMTSLKPFSITPSFVAESSTIATKRKPQVIVIHADAGPDRAVIAARYAATEKDSRLLDVVFVINGEG